MTYFVFVNLCTVIEFLMCTKAIEKHLLAVFIVEMVVDVKREIEKVLVGGLIGLQYKGTEVKGSHW